MNNITHSLIHSGNNDRAKKFIEKLKKEEEIYVLFLGGSVTEGYTVDKEYRFVTLFEDYCKGKYGKNYKFNIRNDGLSGTDSLCGLVKAELNLKKRSPDMVVVEFAINDRKDGLYRMAFESMVVKFLESEKQPLVVLLFVKSKVGYTCQGHMKQIGYYYQVPMISVGDLVSDDYNKGEIEWEDYSDDESHPNKKGHKLIADCLVHYLKEVEEEDASPPYLLPKGSRYGNQYKDLRVVDLGDWNNGVMEKELQFRALFIMYIEEDGIDTGSADIFVDGEYKATLQGYSITGWGRPVVKPVVEGMEEKFHRIHIGMAKGDEGKTIKLICLGVC